MQLKSSLKNHRFPYFILLLVTIFLGIMSRKTTLIPLGVGDLLYAIMIYIIVRILFIHKKAWQIIIVSLLICYGIEILQLYQANWIIELRKTLFGRYVLGQGFLWSDILAYTFGIAIASIIEKNTLK
jgi:hypothetical protein